MFIMFFAAFIISFLVKIETPVKISASGMFGVTISHKGNNNFFIYIIEFLLISLAPPVAIITGSRTIFFILYFFKVS